MYELSTGVAVNTDGIMHAGHPMAFDVIAMDEHNQPVQRGNNWFVVLNPPQQSIITKGKNINVDNGLRNISSEKGNE